MNILITVAETSVARTLLRGGFLARLLENPAIQVTLVTLPGRVEEYTAEFGGARVSVRAMPPVQNGRAQKAIAFLMRNGFRSGTHRIMQHRAYASGESRIPAWVKECLGAVLGSLRPLRALLRWCELRLPPDAALAALLDDAAPDIVFSTIAFDTVVDVPVMREATRRGIRALGTVRGWDNLSTYGIMPVLPGRFLAHNDFLAEKAVALHDVPPDAVSIVGTPAFDIYARKDLLMSREEYCTSIGAAPGSRIILYAAIGDFLFPREGEMADVFEELISSGQVPDGCVAIFRAHPAFPSPLEKMRSLRHVIPDRHAEYATADIRSWDMKAASVAHLVNSLSHASVVVTPGSTVMIEAALAGKPVIAVAFDGRSSERYWFSVARWIDSAVHIVDLLRTGGVHVARTKTDLALAVRDYLADPSADQEGRRSLIERFAGPNRGRAGECIADCLIEEAGRIGKK